MTSAIRIDHILHIFPRHELRGRRRVVNDVEGKARQLSKLHIRIEQVDVVSMYQNGQSSRRSNHRFAKQSDIDHHI